MNSRQTASYVYAQRNGYNGTYDEYQSLQYEGYKAMCKRNEIEPMSRVEWDALA